MRCSELQVFKRRRAVLVEAELSDWLQASTAHGTRRRNAEQLFRRFDGVEVMLDRGRFARVRGSAENIDALEEALLAAEYSDDDHLHAVNGSDCKPASGSPAVTGNNCSFRI